MSRGLTICLTMFLIWGISHGAWANHGPLMRTTIQVSEAVVSLARTIRQSSRILPAGRLTEHPSVELVHGDLVEDLRMVEGPRNALTENDLVFLLRGVSEDLLQELGREFGLVFEGSLVESPKVEISILPDAQALLKRFEAGDNLQNAVLVSRATMRRVRFSMVKDQGAGGAKLGVMPTEQVEARIVDLIALVSTRLNKYLEPPQIEAARDLTFSLSEPVNVRDLLAEADLIAREVQEIREFLKIDAFMEGRAPAVSTSGEHYIDAIMESARRQASVPKNVVPGKEWNIIEDPLQVLGEIRDWLDTSLEISSDELGGVFWKVNSYMGLRDLHPGGPMFFMSETAEQARQTLLHIIRRYAELGRSLNHKLAIFRLDDVYLPENYDPQIVEALIAGESFEALSELTTWLKELRRASNGRFSEMDFSYFFQSVVLRSPDEYGLHIQDLIAQAAANEVQRFRLMVLDLPKVDLYLLKEAASRVEEASDLFNVFSQIYRSGVTKRHFLAPSWSEYADGVQRVWDQTTRRLIREQDQSRHPWLEPFLKLTERVRARNLQNRIEEKLYDSKP